MILRANFEQNILFDRFQQYKPTSYCEIYIWKAYYQINYSTPKNVGLPIGHSDIVTILEWHPRYCYDLPDMLQMKHMTMSICDINLTSISLDWTNQTLVSSWHSRDNGRYPAERNPPGSYTSSVSATIISRLYCGNWKIKAPGDFFSVASTKNMHFSQNSHTLLKSYF